MKIESESAFGGIETIFNLDFLEVGREWTVSPVRPGRLYDITYLEDPEGYAWALKTLGAATLYDHYPASSTHLDIFAEHLLEHEVFVDHLGDYVLPTWFIVRELSGLFVCQTIQPWIAEGVQFKEAIENNRRVSEWQLPPYAERLEVYQGFLATTEDSRVAGKLPDVDLWYENHQGSSVITIADTNKFWYPKLSNDYMRTFHRLSQFLQLD